jgi:hypothetical protein
MSFWKRPFLHFLLLGAAFFAVHAWRGGGGSPVPGSEDAVIQLTAAAVTRLQEEERLSTGMAPEGAALERLVREAVDEEVLFREALALGLDQGDPIIRRRLVQKMAFLTEEIARPAMPSEGELEAFFAAHRERYAMPSRISFELRFFSARRRADPEADARGALESGAPGDPFLLGARHARQDREAVALAFGEAFAEALFALAQAPGTGEGWQGPVRSTFGVHLVRILEKADPVTPPLAQLRERVVRDYLDAALQEATEVRMAALRERYRIEIEMPVEEGAMEGGR